MTEQRNAVRSVLIITGGDIFYERLSEDDLRADYIIAADCGSEKALALGITPDLLVGDFDSSSVPEKFYGIRTVVAPAEKNETDTMLAIMHAESLGAEHITILGGTGGRIDHTLSNIFMLENLRLRGITAVITDGRNRIRVAINEAISLERSSFKYFGILALADSTVSISGCKYPLTGAKIQRALPYAVSNEITADKAIITVDGTVIITES